MLLISAIAGGLGGLSWFLGALMFAGSAVVFILAAGWAGTVRSAATLSAAYTDPTLVPRVRVSLGQGLGAP